jgi:predicted nucleotide-binding protein (sugar kinase/HSP70/actin superfamily)
MPNHSPETRAIPDKLGGANICRPFAFQVADSMAWIDDLKDRGINPERQAVIMEPMAKGPCRFGQYHVLLKKLIAEWGYPGLDILSPDAEKDYSNLPLSDSEILSQAKDFFKGLFCMDVLYDALLRTRPYEKEKGSALACYTELTRKLVTHIESRAGVKALEKFMTAARKRYESLLDPGIPRKPIVAVTGEIYMRLNPRANNDSIVILEKFNLEARLAPLSLWMEYTNKESIRGFRMAGSWKKYFKALVKKRYMEKVAKTLFEPFREYLKGREPHDSEHIIGHAQKDLVYHGGIQGESPLSIGEAYMFASGKLKDISGIFHIGPFGCMQETAATSQIQSVTRRIRQSAVNEGERIIPFMDAVFGDSELSNLEAEIAVFSEKCHVKHRLSNHVGS